MRIPIEFTDASTRRRPPGSAGPSEARGDAGRRRYTMSAPENDFAPEPAAAREAEPAAIPENGPGSSRNTEPDLDAAGNGRRSEATEEPAPGGQESLQALQKRCLRMRADFDNYRRHAEAEKRQLAEVGKEALLEDIYPLIDSLGRAIQTSRGAGANSGILEGLELVRRDFLKALEKHGVERITAVGESFDPRLHEAVGLADHPEYPENVVMGEVRSGFRRGETLLRPAQVLISRGPAPVSRRRAANEFRA